MVWLCLLGGFRLIGLGQPIPVRSGGRTEALLVHLGLAGLHGIPRDVLLRAIWPESEPSLAGQALNSLLRSLKVLLAGALGGAEPVVPTAGQYRLNASAGVAVDVAHFRTLVAQGEQLQREDQLAASATVFRRAVQLYQGDLSLAAGHAGRIALERERLRAMYGRALVRLADDAFATGAFEAALEHAHALLAHDPCREDAHRLVMRCHLRLGERSQALHHYQTVREILRVELDAEPEPATSALFDQIRLAPSDVF
jgi:DNA-binding SARP family transcriptional activator